MDDVFSAAAVFRPGDRVLLGMHRDDLSVEDSVRIREQLHAEFPGVQFVIVAGVSSLAVEPAMEGS
jgi:hypothetical protein